MSGMTLMVPFWGFAAYPRFLQHVGIIKSLFRVDTQVMNPKGLVALITPAHSRKMCYCFSPPKKLERATSSQVVRERVVVVPSHR